MSGDLPLGYLAMPGAGMMPKLVLALMSAFGLILVLRANESPPFAATDWSDRAHATSVAAATAAAVALYTMLGFRLTTTLLLWVLLVGIEHQRVISALIFSAAVALATDFLFGILLNSPLPRGAFGF